MIADIIDLAIFHDNDPVGFLDRTYSLSNDDRRHTTKFFFQSQLDTMIGISIDSTGRIIKDDDLWMF